MDSVEPVAYSILMSSIYPFKAHSLSQLPSNPLPRIVRKPEVPQHLRVAIVSDKLQPIWICHSDSTKAAVQWVLIFDEP